MNNGYTFELESIEAICFSLDANWCFTYVNKKVEVLAGLSSENLLGQSIWETCRQLISENLERFLRHAMAEGQPTHYEDFSALHQTWYEVLAYPLPQGLIIFCHGTTAYRQLEQILRESEYRFKVLNDVSFEAVLIHQDWVVVEANQNAAQLYGYNSPQELIGLSILEHLSPQSQELLQKKLAEGSQGLCEVTLVRKDGSQVLLVARTKVVEYHGQSAWMITSRDLTELKQAEENLRKTQAQLLHAQKMESVGRLAGWITHDFNNFLTAISGYTELILLNLRKEDPLYPDVLEIQKATNSVAALTRQLLAFSRQQVLQPNIVSLNEVVIDMTKLLHRLIGEDIELSTNFDPLLSDVLVDPSQLEQVIINLAVNARDAMPNGGKLTIETANVELDEAYRSAGHPQVKTGEYVMLAISDTGIGMDEATQQKIFEPFFTTKEIGKGTGLGLAIVHGIVKQSGGYVLVYSEVGIGTTLKIYLPKIHPSGGVKSISTPLLKTGDGDCNLLKVGQKRTVLVVEDDNLVRDLIRRVLSEAGYITLEAHDGRQALEISRNYRGKLDLVLTDMIMPQLRGQQLTKLLKKERPGLKVVWMSGYSDRIIGQPGTLEQPYDAFLKNLLLQ